MIPLAFAALALFQGTNPPAKPAPDAVVATIDGKPLTAAEVEPYLWSWRSREVVREVADHRVIEEAAAKRGLTATDAEVKAKVDSQMATIKPNLKPGQTTDAFLESKRLTLAHLTDLARTAVLLDKIVEAEFKPADYVQLDTLVFPVTPGGPAEFAAKAQKAADAAYAALSAGQSWDAVLKANTLPPNPAGQGGPFGWKSVAAFPETIRPQIVALKPLGVTKPATTPLGVQIFRVVAHGTDAPAADVAALKAQYVASSRATVLQKLRDSVKVEIK